MKLSLISTRQAKPHELDLTGLFAQLPNVAWTSEGAIALDELPQRQLQARAQGRWLTVHSVDKFPRMADYAVPAGVRIGDASRVRLGAHLGDGTTVMHEALSISMQAPPGSAWSRAESARASWSARARI